jgi:hypothetical protein
MYSTFSNVRDAIFSDGGAISLLSFILALVALVLAAYALILTLRVRSDLKRYAANRVTDANEFLSTVSHLSNRLDKPH